MRNPIRKLILGLTLSMLLSAASSYAYTTDVQAHRDSVLSIITGAQDWSEQPTIRITQLGAKGDGRTDALPAFRKAMQRARKSQKGLHIIVPEGKYLLNGPIHLVSHITIELAEGAELLFSADPAHYLPVVATSWEGSFCYNYSPMIYGYQLTDVAIIGRGTINGNCTETFPTWRKDQKKDQMLSRDYNHQEVSVEQRVFGAGHLLRPHLVQLYQCQQVTIEDVFITNSPFWCIHLLQCENVICRRVRYDAKLVNNDGIDPEMSRNMLFEDIVFNNGDDNFAIKSGRDNDGWHGLPTENIIIRRCKFKGLHAVVIGSEMSAGVRHVYVEDCTFGGYVKRGLYVKTNPNRGGFVHDIYMSRCEFGEVEDLIYVTSMYAGEGADDIHFTDIHDIHVEDVHARRATNAAVVLHGTEALPLHDISLTRVSADTCRIGFTSEHTKAIILQDCQLGGRVGTVPSQVSQKDNLWR